MFRLLLRWLVLTLTILMVPSLIGGIEVESFGAALAAAAVLGVLNVILRPILVVLTFPFTILTLGLFLLVINAVVFQIAGYLVDGIHIESFTAAFLASLVVTVVSWLLNRAQGETKRVVVYRTHRPSGPDTGSRPMRELNSEN
jgi:putative membrane protein